MALKLFFVSARTNKRHHHLMPASRSKITLRSCCFSTGSAMRNSLSSHVRFMRNQVSTAFVIASWWNTLPSAQRLASPVISGLVSFGNRTNVTGPSVFLRRVTSSWACVSNSRYRWRASLYCSLAIGTRSSLLIASITSARKSTVISYPRLH